MAKLKGKVLNMAGEVISEGVESATKTSKTLTLRSAPKELTKSKKLSKEAKALAELKGKAPEANIRMSDGSVSKMNLSRDIPINVSSKLEYPDSEISKIRASTASKTIPNPKVNAEEVKEYIAPSYRELKGARYNDKTSYMKYKLADEYEDVIKARNKSEYDNPLLKKLGITSKTSMDEIQAMRSKSIGAASPDDMNLGHLMGYHKVPQVATGVAGTAWLVNKMASSNGQQTNSQLYGQSSY